MGGRLPTKPVPAGLHWDEWIVPMPYRDYHDDLHPLQWRSWWDFGDGSATESGTVTNTYAIEARHTYTGLEGTPFVAHLSVTDAAGRSATDTYLIRIRPPSIDVEINLAIDSGLW